MLFISTVDHMFIHQYRMEGPTMLGMMAKLSHVKSLHGSEMRLK
jgi:hypothetical protein